VVLDKREIEIWRKIMTGQTGKIGTNVSEELFKYAGMEVRFLLTSSDCNGTMSVFEFSVPPNFKIPGPAHSNDGYEEMIYGLQGNSLGLSTIQISM
jgi:hypothetical protein